MKVKFSLPTVLLLPLLSSGCSVFMAAYGPEEPNLDVVRIGALRSEIESELAKPVSIDRKIGGDVASYRFVSGDKKSYSRAAVYAVLDVATLGISELIATPVEALQGDRHEIIVSYDKSNRARKIRHYRVNAPLEPPEKIVGLEQDPQDEKPAASKDSRARLSEDRESSSESQPAASEKKISTPNPTLPNLAMAE